MADPYEVAGAYARAFGDAEIALKRSVRLRSTKDHAQANWMPSPVGRARSLCRHC